MVPREVRWNELAWELTCCHQRIMVRYSRRKIVLFQELSGQVNSTVAGSDAEADREQFFVRWMMSALTSLSQEMLY